MGKAADRVSMMGIFMVIFSLLSFSLLAHPVPKTSRAFSQAHHRSTSHVFQRKGLVPPGGKNHQAPVRGRGIASEKEEKVKKIPWKSK